MDVIASRQLLAFDQRRGEFLITVSMGRPYQSADAEWACPVALEGLHAGLAAMHGVDAWQALMLGQSLLQVLLQHHLDSGGTLRDPETGDPVDVTGLFHGGGS